VADAEAGNILVKQLALKNANKACKAALQPYRKRATLQEMIRICVDVRPSHIQGIALAADLKEVFRPGGRKKGACFPYGKEGHFARECWNMLLPQLGDISAPMTGPPTGANGPRTSLPECCPRGGTGFAEHGTTAGNRWALEGLSHGGHQQSHSNRPAS
jgi:hypothetical protein